MHYINEEIEPKERKIYLEKNIRLRGQIELEEDLHKTLTLISSKWKMQNNRKDQQTGFIYRTQSLEECLQQIEKTGVNMNYALHRWYNFKTSVQCEYIFCEYGAIHETMKSNFSLMREQISAFMEQVKEDGLHEITITDQGKTYRLKSDIIYLH